MLWGARIPTVKKYGLVVLFSGGIFVMVAGLLRCILILKACLVVAKSPSSPRDTNTLTRIPKPDPQKDPHGLSGSPSLLSSHPTCQVHGDGCDRSSSPFSVPSYRQTTTRAQSIKEDPSQEASCSETKEGQAGGVTTDGHSSLASDTRTSMTEMIATSSFMVGKPVRMRLFRHRGMMVSPKRSSLLCRQAQNDDGSDQLRTECVSLPRRYLNNELMSNIGKMAVRMMFHMCKTSGFE